MDSVYAWETSPFLHFEVVLKYNDEGEDERLASREDMVFVGTPLKAADHSEDRVSGYHSNHDHTPYAPEDDEEVNHSISDPVEDNFTDHDVDTDHENEGIPLKARPPSSSNESDDIDDEINDAEKNIIREHEFGDVDDQDHGHEPGSVPPLEFPHGINSNVELIKYPELESRRLSQCALMNGGRNVNGEGDVNGNVDRRAHRKNSITALNCSMTSQLDDGFGCNIVAEEEEEVKLALTRKPVFDAQGVERPKNVKYVAEDDADLDDMFGGTVVNDDPVAMEMEEIQRSDKPKGGNEADDEMKGAGLKMEAVFDAVNNRTFVLELKEMRCTVDSTD